MSIDRIAEIDVKEAYPLLAQFHYSPTMPRLTKHYLGIFENTSRLVGVCTLGWGTQPKGTINKLFPGLVSEDYYEIGKMAMLDEMPKNSESQMLSLVVQWLQTYHPEKKFLYSLADGIVGKPGYVYQASNFLSGGFFWADVYMSAEGEKIHPRNARSLLEENRIFLNREKRVFWMTPAFMIHKGIRRIKGKMFRYIYPLSKKARNMLSDSTVNWGLNHPKHDDLQWKDATAGGRAVLLDEMPSFALRLVNHNRANVEAFQ